MKNTKLFSGLVATTLLTQTLMPGVTAMAQEVAAATAVTAELKVMHTSDIHGNLMDYDYYTNQNGAYGLTRVATLIEAERAAAKNVNFPEVDNSMLFENGDLIQGNPLGDYYATVNPVQPGETHPIYEALNTLGFDGATAGNHEFNFGLDFLKQIVGEFNAPYLNANVKMTGTNAPLFGEGTEYQILEEEVVTSEGNIETVKVGVTGLVAPAILRWDESHLKGKVEVEDMVQAATRVTAEMKAQGADVVVVMAHTGAGNGNGDVNAENAGLDLLAVPGLDLVMAGHSHFSTTNQDANTFLVQPAEWGKELGVMDFGLVKQADGSWNVDMSESTARVAKVTADTPNNPAMVATVSTAHEATLDYVATAVATSEIAIDSYFSQVTDNLSLELVQQAQTWYVENQIANGNADLAPYAELPILSAAAPFKAGGRNYDDLTYYVDIAAGELTMGDFSNLYIYPNTLTVVKVTGEDVKNWLEVSAGQFNQITPGTQGEELLNTNFRSYNFDVINGVTYQIDVTQPARFVGGKLVDANANRIVNLEFNGEAINPNQEFLIITNNYRAGGGDFAPAVNGDKIVLADSIENRQVITEYAQMLGTVTADNLQVDHNWSLADVDQTTVNFTSATKATEQTQWYGNTHISEQENNGAGLSTYTIDLDTTKAISIMHTNDMHGRLAAESSSLGVAKLKTFVDEVNPDFLFDAGDAFQGLPLSNESKGMMMLEAMNAIGYDAMTVGNHEFDFGYEQAKTYVNEADFPILASNILDKMTNESAFEQTHMFEAYGIQVGVVGVATPETAEKTHPDNVTNVTFQNPYTTTQAAVNQLQADGADIIIALSHLGLDASSTDRADLLAEQVEGLDLIIDGHSHTTLTEPMVVNGTPIVQTGEYLKNVGLVTVEYNTLFDTLGTIDARLEETAGNLANLAENPELKTIVEQAQADFDDRTNIPVFESEVTFDGAREHVRTRETNLGNMITDAMADYGQTGGFKNRTDFAVTNGGGIRANLNVGTVTLKDIITVLPYGNQIAQIPLTGSEIIAMYEKSLGAFPAANGGFLQSSKDIRVNYNVANESGSRVLSIAIADENGVFQPLDEAKTYYVAMPDFLSVGGDGYTMLAGKPREEGITLDSVVAEFTQAAGFDSKVYTWENGPERLLAIEIAADEIILANPETTIDTTKNTINFGEFIIQYLPTMMIQRTTEMITFVNSALETMMTLDLVNGTLTMIDQVTKDEYVITEELFSFNKYQQRLFRSQAVTAYQIDLTTKEILVDGQVVGTYTGDAVLTYANDGSIQFTHPTQVGLPAPGEGSEGTVTPEVQPEADQGFGPDGNVTPEVGQTTDGTPQPEGTLPDTGMSQAEAMLVVGALVMLTGTATVVARRKHSA